MIINFNEYGKILSERPSIRKAFLNYFDEDNNYYLATGFRNSEYNPITEYHQHSKYKYDVGFYNKVNHHDLPSLFLKGQKLKNTFFGEVAGGYKQIDNPSFIDAELSECVYSVFVFLKMYLGESYQIVMVRPNDFKEFIISSETYNGILSFKGNIFFSSIPKDNIKGYYDVSHYGVGVKLLVKDKEGNAIRVAKADIIYQNDKPIGINFEIDLNALNAIKNHYPSAIYGSNACTDDIAYFIKEEEENEKMVNALLGILGIYTSFKNISLVDQNIIKIYIDVIASICIIKDYSLEDLRTIIEKMLEGLHKSNPKMVDSLIEAIDQNIKLIYDVAYHTKRKKELKNYREIAVDKIQSKEAQRIKKPQ